VSPVRLGGERLRIRAGDVAPTPTPGLTTFGRFDLCFQPDSPYPLGLAGKHLLLEQAPTSAASPSLGGVFDRLGAQRGIVADPDDRETTGVLVVLVDNLDPTREDEFNRWYDEVHVPDILAAGSFHHATRYGAAGPAALAAYLTVYETDWRDPEAAQQAMAARPNPAGLWDAIMPVHLAIYRRR
jgi:hypothetical protein